MTTPPPNNVELEFKGRKVYMDRRDYDASYGALMPEPFHYIAVLGAGLFSYAHMYNGEILRHGVSIGSKEDMTLIREITYEEWKESHNANY